MMIDDIQEAPLPADFEQAIDEVFQLRRILWRERQILAQTVEAKEKFRRELSAVSKRSAEKDRKIEQLRGELDLERGQKKSDLLQSPAAVRVALRDLVASVEAAKTRDTIVLRDIEAARAVLEDTVEL